MESVLKSRLGMFCAALALAAVSGAAVADEVATVPRTRICGRRQAATPN